MLLAVIGRQIEKILTLWVVVLSRANDTQGRVNRVSLTPARGIFGFSRHLYRVRNADNFEKIALFLE